MVEEWNATAAAYPAARYTACWRRRRRARPTRRRSFDEEALTYGELNARANRLAHHLRARGVGPEAVVGLCMERGGDGRRPAGVLKAGGAYVPLDPAYPPERLRFMLADGGAGGAADAGAAARRARRRTRASPWC